MSTTEATSLRELASLFLRLGATAFGGPAVHIAMMRDEVVTRRGWLTDERFLDLVGATNLIPGPNSTEMAIHIGWARRRWSGLVVAGLGFILPAVLISCAVAWIYVRFGALPQAGWLLYGVKPVIVAVVVQAIVGLAPKAMTRAWLWWLALLAASAAAMGMNEIAVLLAAGVAAVVTERSKLGDSSSRELRQWAPWIPVTTSVVATSAVSPVSLFGVFLKTGSVLFGSGYVLLAFLRADLVTRLGWLTEAQLIDAVAVGQITPGPVFTTATFIGYVLHGPTGAVAATAGIFLPAFIFVAISGPLVPRVRASRTAGAFLDGVNVASLALMALVTVQLGRAAVVDVLTMTFALVAAVCLLRWRTNATWLVLAGAAAGWCAHALGLANV